MTDQELIDFTIPKLKRDEADIPFLYSDKKGPKVKIKDPYGGKITIGVGWNIEDRGLPQEVVDWLLVRAIKDAISDCNKLYPNFRNLSTPRQSACVNLCFNMGLPTMSTFVSVNTFIRSNQFRLAASRLRKTLYAKQVGDRALRVANLLEFEREE